jgi:two-component system sensor histidine kinase VanS
MRYSKNQVGPMYIEKNKTAVKEMILKESQKISEGTSLKDTDLIQLSSETSYVRYEFGVITEKIGPDFIEEDDILSFVLELDKNEQVIIEDNLTYFEVINDDIHQINYIYEFRFGDYLIVSTKIQSLQNIELVLNEINTTQSVLVFVTILVLSAVISYTISVPIRKITRYTTHVARLNFDEKLELKRNDEFSVLAQSLNEMTFNLKESYKKLNDSNKKLFEDVEFKKEQEEKKKQLIYTINHELKTPLAVMKGMIEGMIDEVGRYKDKQHYLKEVYKEIEKVETITSNLTYSLKLEDKVKNDEYTSMESLKDTFSLLDEYANLKGKKIKKKMLVKDVLFNSELLHIVVSNVVKNAINYSTKDTITINTYLEDDLYVFEVKNKGHIDEKHLSRIYDSFYRVENSSVEGNGLGLHIVKEICKLYSYDCEIFNHQNDVVFSIKMLLKK